MLNKTLGCLFCSFVRRVVAVHLKHLILPGVDLPVHLDREGVRVETDVKWLLDSVAVAADLFFGFSKRLGDVIVWLHRADGER